MPEDPPSPQNNADDAGGARIIPINASQQASDAGNPLRAELHAIVDEVMDSYDSAVSSRERLKSDLQNAFNRVINQHITTEPLRSALAKEMQGAWGKVQDMPESIDAAMAHLDMILQQRVAAAGPGMKRSAWAAARQAQKLVPVVVGILAGIAEDPEKQRLARDQLETLLARYMSPSKAVSIVDMAISALEAAFKRKP